MAENNVKKYIDYIWISKFRGIENQGFQFTCKYTYDYDDETKKLTRKKNEEYPNYIDNFFGDMIEINAVIGKNGGGKTSLMQAIYEFFNCKKIRSDEKMLLVFSDGSVYSKKDDSFKISVYNEESPIDWDNGSDEPFSDIKCIYHTNVLDFQSVDFCDHNSNIDTNISLTSLLVDHSLRVISEDEYEYNGNVSRLLKAFFYREFGRQIRLFEKIARQDDNKLEIKFPKYAYITPKSLDSIIYDLEQMFDFNRGQLSSFFEDFHYLYNVDTTMDRFKSTISPCILATLLYMVCCKISVDSISLPGTKKKYSSPFSENDRYEIVLNILKCALDKTRKIDRAYRNVLSNNAWSIVYIFLKILNENSGDYINLRFELNKEVHTLIQKINRNLFDIDSNDSDFAEILDREIEADLKIIGNRADSLQALMKYISDISDTAENIDTLESEESGLSFRVAIADDESENDFDIAKLWEEYRSIFIIYDFLNISWNLSSGENARLAMFARIYEKSENYKLRSCKQTKNLIILFDEADMLLHPEWQQNFVEQVRIFMEMMFSKISIQIIIATHSPIMLSDIPRQNTLLLKRDDNGNIECKKGKETFAANIFSLYQNSFFIEDTGIGSFAKTKLEEMVNAIHDKGQKKCSNDELMKYIDAVGDVYLRAKLKQEFFMYCDRDEKSKEDGKVTMMRAELKYKSDELENTKIELEKTQKELEQLKALIGGIDQ